MQQRLHLVGILFPHIKFSAVYGTVSFTTAFTQACYMTLS